MSELRTMTMAEYARARSVSHDAIRHAVERGVIILLGGRVDVAQADAAWYSSRRARIGGVPDDPAVRSAESKIVAGFAKLRLFTEELERLRGKHLVSDEIKRTAASELTELAILIDSVPTEYAPFLSQQMKLDMAQAEPLLTRFLQLIRGEL